MSIQRLKQEQYPRGQTATLLCPKKYLSHGCCMGEMGPETEQTICPKCGGLLKKDKGTKGRVCLCDFVVDDMVIVNDTPPVYSQDSIDEGQGHGDPVSSEHLQGDLETSMSSKMKDAYGKPVEANNIFTVKRVSKAQKYSKYDSCERG